MYFLHKSLKEPIRIKYEAVMRMRENNRVYDLVSYTAMSGSLVLNDNNSYKKVESLEKSPNVIRRFVQNKCRLGFS